jgi:hypothetical protein
MNYQTISTLILMILTFGSFAQVPDFGNTQIVNGFSKKISGNDFNYNSSIPTVKACLLIRATNGKSSMEWETEPVPEKIKNNYVTFVWLAGLGSSPGRARFDLQINGIQKFSFWTDNSDKWKQDADDGSTLSFQNDMTDQNGDRYGFMYLKIPSKLLQKGKPLRLKVTGAAMNKTSWVMTFKFHLKPGLTFKPFPAIITENGKEYQLGTAGILHFGQPAKAKIFLDNKLIKETGIHFGYNYVKVKLPKVEKSKTIGYKLQIGDFSDEGEITVNPVRKWQVNFVQHTHTDIGYTRPQTEILAEHLRYIDYALDYCDNTDDYPENSKFRWTCEAAWPVDEYLRSRPAAQIERLKKRIAEGRIELAGMYFNFDELPDEQILAASLQPIKHFNENGLPVKVAMQNDVNGIGWCLNDYFNDLGIRYLNMGTHGHRALIPFDIPTLFWWESPSGKRLLTFRAEHYKTGNTVFKIHAGNFEIFENELLSYLTNLEKKGYKFDLIAIQHSGFLTDNSPPSTSASEMIKQWNEKFVWPKLKTATVSKFFEEMEAKHSTDLPVIRGAWPDWWTDGFGASAREVATVRTAQTDLIANSAGLTMAALQGAKMPEKIDDRIETANSALLFYTEHTVGYHGSVNEPFSKNTMEQRALKESYAWEAGRRAKIVGEETMGLLQSYFQREKEPLLLVFNTLNWTRSGVFTTYIDNETLPRDANFKIVDKNGNEAKAQLVEKFSDGAYWAIWVNDIPAFGVKKYVIKTNEDEVVQQNNNTLFKDNTIENQWYKITIDNESGAISGIFDKELQKELVDQNAEYKLGEFIYELLDNRAQMESYKLEDYTREPLDSVWFDSYSEGKIWNTVKFKGNTKAANYDGSYSFEIRVFKSSKRIDLVYSINKKMVTEPEGIYIAFPFTLENGKLFFDVQGGEMEAGVDQIPGSANDWNTVQNYARLKNNNAQIILSSKETPLMQFGGINTGRYKAGATPETTHIFGWPMNNYWTTNFNAEQHGGITWSYTISSAENSSQTTATQFGWGNRIPFLSRVLPGGSTGKNSWEGSFISGWPENILLVSSFPAANGKSAIIHIRETEGKKVSLKLKNEITGVALKMQQTDVLGEPVKNGTPEINAYESKFFKVVF